MEKPRYQRKHQSLIDGHDSNNETWMVITMKTLAATDLKEHIGILAIPLIENFVAKLAITKLFLSHLPKPISQSDFKHI